MMNKIVLLLFLAMTPLLVQSQELYKISFDRHQLLKDGTASLGNQFKLPTTKSTIVLSGLNDLDGMGSYLNIYGNKLIIDSLEHSFDGTKRVILRREDGREFYNLFQTLTVKLTPMSPNEKEELLNE